MIVTVAVATFVGSATDVALTDTVFDAEDRVRGAE